MTAYKYSILTHVITIMPCLTIYSLAAEPCVQSLLHPCTKKPVVPLFTGTGH